MRAHVLLGLFSLCIAIALGATACGGGTSAGTTATAPRAAAPAPQRHARTRYVVQMRRLGSTLSASIATVANADSKPNTSPAKVAANLAKVQAALRRAASVLASIQPPARVRTDHALLVKGVREYAAELNGVIRQLRGGQVIALKTIPTLRGVRDMQRASYAIVQKGYAIVG